MRVFTFLALAAVAGFGITATTHQAQAQVSVDVAIGVAPECPYGYYDTAPYGCAPTGYYGPEWFNGDGFIGAGPWFHGAADFHGNVNNRLHPDNGYKGPVPQRGEKAEASKRVDSGHFQGNEARDGRGHVSEKH
jgi:hypothetical protein